MIIKHGQIGDNIFILPAYHMMRASIPDSSISYLTLKDFAPLMKGFPGLDRVYAVDKEPYHRKNLREAWRNTSDLLRWIRHARFDLVVDFQGSGETACLTLLTRARDRWGVTRQDRRLYARAYTVGYDRNNGVLHWADRNRELLVKAGMKPTPVRNDFVLPREECGRAWALFDAWGLSCHALTVFIQPFTGSADKNWPLGRYLALAAYWKEQGVQVVIGGGSDERQALAMACDAFPIAAGRADLLATAALMSLATIIVGGDTGLLHLAVAMGKRVVMLMGPTSPAVHGPYGHPEWALTPNGDKRMDEIELSKAIAITRHALVETARRTGA